MPSKKVMDIVGSAMNQLSSMSNNPKDASELKT